MCPRLTAAMILLGFLVQVKGFGFALMSSRKWWMASLSSWRDRNTPRLRRFLVSLAKKPSTALSQEADVGVKWNKNRGLFVDPFQHLGMLVSSIVVDNDMDRFLLGHPDVDNGKEADELLMAMMLHTLANDLALKHIERGEQSGDAVTLVVVGHGASPTLFHRQPRLGAIQRLDLAFLIDREHDGMVGRVDVQPDDRVRPPLGSAAECARDAFCRAKAPPRPPRRTVPASARSPSWPAGGPHDVGSAMTIDRQQDNLRAPNAHLRAVAVSHHRLKRAAVGGTQSNVRSLVHPADSHTRVCRGIP